MCSRLPGIVCRGVLPVLKSVTQRVIPPLDRTGLTKLTLGAQSFVRQA
jgi:hypothetical protein